MTDNNKPKPPEKPAGPPVRRIINEKVINKKQIDEWSKNRKQG